MVARLTGLLVSSLLGERRPRILLVRCRRLFDFSLRDSTGPQVSKVDLAHHYSLVNSYRRPHTVESMGAACFCLSVVLAASLFRLFPLPGMCLLVVFVVRGVPYSPSRDVSVLRCCLSVSSSLNRPKVLTTF